MTPMQRRVVSGFTVAEMIISLLIAAVIITLVFSVLSVSRGIKDDLTCASNLRQIGTGILAYAADHGGSLPGPLLVGQYPYWEAAGGGDTKVLATHLQDYLSVVKTRWKDGGDVFHCPANRRMVTSRREETPVFMVNTEVLMDGHNGPQAPFGYPNTYYANYRYNLSGGVLRDAIFKDGVLSDELPVNLIRLDQIIDQEGRPARTTTWALKDIDQTEPILDREKASYRKRVPSSMPHRTHRNALFFDFRVGRIDEFNQPL